MTKLCRVPGIYFSLLGAPVSRIDVGSHAFSTVSWEDGLSQRIGPPLTGMPSSAHSLTLVWNRYRSGVGLCPQVKGQAIAPARPQ